MTMVWRRLLVVAALFTAFAAPSHAQDAARDRQEIERFVRSVYAMYDGNIDRDGDPDAGTPPFNRTIYTDDMVRASTNQLAQDGPDEDDPGYNLLCACQDFDKLLVRAIVFDRVTPQQAMAWVTFDNTGTADRAIVNRQTVGLTLQRTAAGWRIADVQTDGNSMRSQLRLRAVPWPPASAGAAPSGKDRTNSVPGPIRWTEIPRARSCRLTAVEGRCRQSIDFDGDGEKETLETLPGGSGGAFNFTILRSGAKPSVVFHAMGLSLHTSNVSHWGWRVLGLDRGDGIIQRYVSDGTKYQRDLDGEEPTAQGATPVVAASSGTAAALQAAILCQAPVGPELLGRPADARLPMEGGGAIDLRRFHDLALPNGWTLIGVAYDPLTITSGYTTNAYVRAPAAELERVAQGEPNLPRRGGAVRWENDVQSLWALQIPRYFGVAEGTPYREVRTARMSRPGKQILRVTIYGNGVSRVDCWQPPR